MITKSVFGMFYAPPLQPPQYQADHRHFEGFHWSAPSTRGLTQRVVPHQPPRCLLYDPAVGLAGEAFGGYTPFDDL